LQSPIVSYFPVFFPPLAQQKARKGTAFTGSVNLVQELLIVTAFEAVYTAAGIH
jgi:hypothetical protein